jgi:hypothetical protein
MALYCNTCIGAICNHCLHFKVDSLDDDDDVETVQNDDEDGDGFDGECLLHQERINFDQACFYFLCHVAAKKGVGYERLDEIKSVWAKPLYFSAEAGQQPFFLPPADQL